MKRIALTALVAATAGCAFADPDGEPWTIEDESITSPANGDDKADVYTEPTPVEELNNTEPKPVEPLSCALEATNFRQTWWLEPSLHAFSPNEGLFIVADGFDHSASVVSVATGETYSTTNLAGLESVDDNWTTGWFGSRETVGAELRDVTSGQVHFTTETHIAATAVSGDGTHAAAVQCEDDKTLVSLIEVGGGVQTVTLETGAPCYSWGPNRTFLKFTPGGDLVVATMSGTLWTVDADTMELDSVVPHPLPQDPNEFYYSTIITDVVVHPVTGEVVTTGYDGALRRWSADLDQVGGDIEVGAFRINEMTYAPQYTVSPVAFSPDGSTMAFVNVDGDVVLTNAAGDEVLESPDPGFDDEFQRAENVPVTLAFADSGQRVGVGYYWGPAVWGCPGEEIERNGALSLDVPAEIEFSEANRATIPAQVDGASPVTALRITTLDGEHYSQAYFVDGQLTVWPRHDQPQIETIVLEADDGFATASATIQLRFTP